MKDVFRKTRFISFSSSFCFVTTWPARRIVRKLWWTNQRFYPVDTIPSWSPCSLSLEGWMNNMSVGGRSSETWSLHIDMIAVINRTSGSIGTHVEMNNRNRIHRYTFVMLFRTNNTSMVQKTRVNKLFRARRSLYVKLQHNTSKCWDLYAEKM
jgi:hypothetical protein